ncbi:MAG: beta/alpha barrel domain-containing protein, partial [Planctomycetota bacterium]
MNDSVDISVEFAGVRLANPVFTASGTCGYADELADYMDVGALGGFITKSITVRPRKGNPAPRIVETDAGMLNAIGLANVGLEEFIREKLPVIESRFSNTAVFVNVAGETIEDYVAVVERLASEKAI